MRPGSCVSLIAGSGDDALDSTSSRSPVLMRFLRRPSLACLALAACFLAGCASSPIPAPVEPAVKRTRITDAELVEQARRQWYVMADPSRQAEWGAAIAAYNSALDLLIRRVRYDYFGANMSHVRPETYGFTIAGDAEKIFHMPDVYRDMVPARDIDLDDLKERYTVPGVGVPLAGVVQADKARRLSVVRVIKDKENVHTVTAVLTFPKDPKSRELPSMHFYLRLNREDVPIGRYRYGLAADFSAPIALYWKMTDVARFRLLGLFRPQKAVTVRGLSFNEPYDSRKIPVVLAHGLMSSPNTFANMVNRLLKDSEIRKRYQFWYFGYPTGIPWMLSAAEYRRALREVRDELDPRRRDANWDKMVVVGHSMGGLLTRYNLSLEPWLLLKGLVSSDGEKLYFNKKYIDEPLPVQSFEAFRHSFYFRPLEEPSRAIFLATPHRGAPFADSWISAIGSAIIHLPGNLVEEAVKIVTLQDDMFLLRTPDMIRNFTSIRQLSPKSLSIRNLSNVPLRDIPVHSIIGDRGRHNTPCSSDGIVPYWSSHLGWSRSEKIVPHDHSVQDDPATAEEVARILKLHLKAK